MQVFNPVLASLCIRLRHFGFGRRLIVGSCRRTDRGLWRGGRGDQLNIAGCAASHPVETGGYPLIIAPSGCTADVAHVVAGIVWLRPELQKRCRFFGGARLSGAFSGPGDRIGELPRGQSLPFGGQRLMRYELHILAAGDLDIALGYVFKRPPMTARHICPAGFHRLAKGGKGLGRFG